MKKITALLIVTFCLSGISTSSFAQKKNINSGINDPKANNILDKAYQKIKSTSGIKFDATMINKNSKKKETNRQSAKVLFQGDKYQITFGETTIFCDGTAVYQWDKENKEVTVNKISASETDLMNPSKLLKNYNKNFRPKLIREESANYIIDLTPRTPQKYHKIRVSVNKKYQISKVEIYYYDSSRTEYQISKYQENVKCTNNDFTFNAASHKDVEVIDMR